MKLSLSRIAGVHACLLCWFPKLMGNFILPVLAILTLGRDILLPGIQKILIYIGWCVWQAETEHYQSLKRAYFLR